ncbi:hypothetical protein [Leptolyngbya sp. 7M]|uniref:hypothetical protein n=1 Tax=Leptolyngbya sp. 7M TaxID=2812896 RepID=UPI0021F209BE|nr:hypothetical protein [Leptolyngbya sp. 7M]
MLDQRPKAVSVSGDNKPLSCFNFRPDLVFPVRNYTSDCVIDNHIPSSDPVLFYEIDLGDASEFRGKLRIRGVDIDGYKILRTEAPAVPNAIAALLLHLRDRTGKIPHVYFGWSEGNPIMYLARYILFGEGDTAPVTREILRQAEPDPELRPNVHVGG